jgi:hypothetical protein
MLRVNSILMVILLAAPMVSDCCLPQPPPFDESKHSDDDGCFWSEQAIVETKETVAARITIDHRLPFTAILLSETLASDRYFTPKAEVTGLKDGIDLYLRSRTLRI